VDFGGKYYQFKGLSQKPNPIQKPHPPLYIGSWDSSNAGLKRVAKYGDGWMASTYNITPDKFKEKWSAIRSYGRNFGNPKPVHQLATKIHEGEIFLERF